MNIKKILVVAIMAIGSISHSKEWEFTKLKTKGIDNSFLCYEDARFITDQTSPQYKFLKGASPKNYGIYNKNNTYLVAVERRYGSIGDQIPSLVKKTGDFSSYIKRYAGGIKIISNKKIK